MRTKALKNTLALLLAVLALTFFAACSSEDDSDTDPDPAYCGTWAPTQNFIDYLKKLDDLSSVASYLTTSSLSLEISSDGTLTVSAMGYVTIPGTYTYDGDDSSGTFKFTLDYSQTGVATLASGIGGAFAADKNDENSTAPSITYTTDSLSVTLNEGDTNATTIFTK